MAHSTNYNDIINMFVMPDKPTEIDFDPAKDAFLELVEYALRKAFADFNFRTLTKANEFEDAYSQWVTECMDGKEKATITNYLIERLVRNNFLKRFQCYFKGDPPSEKDFDRWHNKTCQRFLDILNSEPMVYTDLKYGKAQKIVNMMFKHLYCLEGAAKYSDNFAPCHMPLDSFTLEWFRREVAEKWYNSKKEDKPKISISSEKPNPKWSNISFKEDSLQITYEDYDKNKNNDRTDDGYYHYMFFVTMIRKYFSDAKKENNRYSGLTPFQAEFYIWPEIQLRLCAENFIYQLDPDTYNGNSARAKEAKRSLKDKDVDELLNKVKETIKMYEGR